MNYIKLINSSIFVFIMLAIPPGCLHKNHAINSNASPRDNSEVTVLIHQEQSSETRKLSFFITEQNRANKNINNANAAFNQIAYVKDDIGLVYSIKAYIVDKDYIEFHTSIVFIKGASETERTYKIKTKLFEEFNKCVDGITYSVIWKTLR